MTRGSVIRETMRTRASQVPQVKGSVSTIFYIKRARVLRASLQKSELARVSDARVPAEG